MRESTEAIIARFFAALNASDISTLLELLHEDVAHDAAGGREIGREKYRWYLAERAKPGASSFRDLVIMSNDDGTRAAAEFTLRDKDKTGASRSLQAGMFFAIDGGRIVRITDCGMPAG